MHEQQPFSVKPLLNKAEISVVPLWQKKVEITTNLLLPILSPESTTINTILGSARSPHHPVSVSTVNRPAFMSVQLRSHNTEVLTVPTPILSESQRVADDPFAALFADVLSDRTTLIPTPTARVTNDFLSDNILDALSQTEDTLQPATPDPFAALWSNDSQQVSGDIFGTLLEVDNPSIALPDINSTEHAVEQSRLLIPFDLDRAKSGIENEAVFSDRINKVLSGALDVLVYATTYNHPPALYETDSFTDSAQQEKHAKALQGVEAIVNLNFHPLQSDITFGEVVHNRRVDELVGELLVAQKEIFADFDQEKITDLILLLRHVYPDKKNAQEVLKKIEGLKDVTVATLDIYDDKSKQANYQLKNDQNELVTSFSEIEVLRILAKNIVQQAFVTEEAPFNEQGLLIQELAKKFNTVGRTLSNERDQSAYEGAEDLFSLVAKKGMKGLEETIQADAGMIAYSTHHSDASKNTGNNEKIEGEEHKGRHGSIQMVEDEHGMLIARRMDCGDCTVKADTNLQNKFKGLDSLQVSQAAKMIDVPLENIAKSSTKLSISSFSPTNNLKPELKPVSTPQNLQPVVQNVVRTFDRGIPGMLPPAMIFSLMGMSGKNQSPFSIFTTPLEHVSQEKTIENKRSKATNNGKIYPRKKSSASSISRQRIIERRSQPQVKRVVRAAEKAIETVVPFPSNKQARPEKGQQTNIKKMVVEKEKLTVTVILNVPALSKGNEAVSIKRNIKKDKPVPVASLSEKTKPNGIQRKITHTEPKDITNVTPKNQHRISWVTAGGVPFHDRLFSSVTKAGEVTEQVSVNRPIVLQQVDEGQKTTGSFEGVIATPHPEARIIRIANKRVAKEMKVDLSVQEKKLLQPSRSLRLPERPVLKITKHTLPTTKIFVREQIPARRKKGYISVPTPFQPEKNLKVERVKQTPIVSYGERPAVAAAPQMWAKIDVRSLVSIADTKKEAPQKKLLRIVRANTGNHDISASLPVTDVAGSVRKSDGAVITLVQRRISHESKTVISAQIAPILSQTQDDRQHTRIYVEQNQVENYTTPAISTKIERKITLGASIVDHESAAKVTGDPTLKKLMSPQSEKHLNTPIHTQTTIPSVISSVETGAKLAEAFEQRQEKKEEQTIQEVQTQKQEEQIREAMDQSWSTDHVSEKVKGQIEEKTTQTAQTKQNKQEEQVAATTVLGAQGHEQGHEKVSHDVTVDTSFGTKVAKKKDVQSTTSSRQETQEGNITKATTSKTTQAHVLADTTSGETTETVTTVKVETVAGEERDADVGGRATSISAPTAQQTSVSSQDVSTQIIEKKEQVEGTHETGTIQSTGQIVTKSTMQQQVTTPLTTRVTTQKISQLTTAALALNNQFISDPNDLKYAFSGALDAAWKESLTMAA